MKLRIIAVSDPKYLIKNRPSYGIPTEFWIAQKGAFPTGTPPTLIYKDPYKGLIAICICNGVNSHDIADDMLFKLVRRTILRLKDELLSIWEGSNINYSSFKNKFISLKDMTVEQHERLSLLNCKLSSFQERLNKQFDWATANYPDHCNWANINYILSENDPDFSIDDDNILFTQKENSPNDVEEYNSNNSPLYTFENSAKQRHCWLYYDLWANSGLTWEDILRIEKIWVQFRINFDIDFNIFENKI